MALFAPPGGAGAADPAAAGGAELRLGVGGGPSPGAPVVLLGAGLGLFDDGATRLDVQGHLAFGAGAGQDFDVPGVARGHGRVQSFGFLSELTLARRFGRLEPWVGAGISFMTASGDFDYFCGSEAAPGCAGAYLQSRTETFSGSTVVGASVSGGLRLAISPQLLLEASLRHQKEGPSRFEDLPVSARVGGTSAMVSVVARLGGRPLWMGSRSASEGAAGAPPAPAAPAAAEPVTRVEVAPVLEATAAPCAPGGSPVFAAHVARRFRCFPDPVRGGFRCDEGGSDGEFAEIAACEERCRAGSERCAESGAIGQACLRCVEGCAERRWVPCRR